MTEKELPLPAITHNTHNTHNSHIYESDNDEEEENKIYHNSEYDNIEKLRKEITTDISNLQIKIEKILNKRENNYLSTFDEFMDTVRKDLKQKIEQMERVEKEKRKNNDIKIVTSERDFFRQEAIRLNQLCKELNSKNEDMSRELKFQTNELMSISKKWKDSENTNKQLIVELERNIQVNKELEYQFKLSQENVNQMQFNNLNLPINENLEEENYDYFNKEKFVKIIEKFKIDLKKERVRNHKILAELNKIMLDQNKLEKIFIDCVEEGRKEIFNRKFKDSFANRTMSFNSMSKTGTIPFINDIKYDNFLPGDKRKLLEVFMMKEEVINLIKDHVFKKIEYGAQVYDTKSEYNTGTGNQLNSTRNSFLKTDKLFSVRKKKPNSGFTYTMQIRSKTPNINNI